MHTVATPGPFVALGVVLCSAPLVGESGDEYFERRVRPLLFEHCSQCHGEQLQSAGIDFRKPETVLGTTVISGDESSPLVRAVRYESAIKMPPSSKLPGESIDTLVDWIRMGAPWPGYEPVQTRESAGEAVPESDHWAFQPIADPAVPDVGMSGWVRNDIDRFILARLREHGLDPAPEAGRLTLLRRATFDLHGLPPSREEVRRVAADSASDALGRLVEDLLGSPHYGERWGRHWLDVARYADSSGVDEDHPFGDSWRYRDYVVNAFNDDLSFRQFAREQIAGDLLPAPRGAPVNARGIVATGFLALGPMAFAQRDPVQKKYDVVDEQVDTLSKAFLGLTVACARCHDHKFDPILTTDYYALAGIFASTRTFDDWRKDGSRYYKHPLIGQEEYERHKAGADKIDRLETITNVARRIAVLRFLSTGPVAQVSDYMLAAVGAAGADGLDGETLDWFRDYLQPRPSPRAHLARWRAAEGDAAVAASYRDELAETVGARLSQFEVWLEQAMETEEPVSRAALLALFTELPKSLLYRDLLSDEAPFEVEYDEVADRISGPDRSQIKSLETRMVALREALPEEPPMANSVAEGENVQQRVFVRGQHKNPGASVAKRFPLVLAGPDQPEIPSGSGRLELANWIVSERNPLAARVIVNRVWLWHFGEGLVRTPNNYGIRGEPPTHPLLLDWLARRFMGGGWSVKNLHRMIMDSATYRMSSSISREAYAQDPENRLWSRFERRRLSIEELRDSYLRISGRLDPTMGGDTDVGSGELVEFDRNNRRIDPDDYTRRSIYLPLMRNKLPNLLGLFDFGDATTANGKRSVTNVAPQALYLMNSDFARDAADAIVEALDGSASERVEQAYRRVLSRPPTAEESDRAAAYVRAYSAERPAWASLCKMLLASNEFHFVE